MTGEIKVSARVEGATEVFDMLHRASVSIRKRAAGVVKAASFALERRIKSDMPVDTGRARASWGHWTPDAIIRTDLQANAGDAHWLERDGGLTVEQGTNVDYVEMLNRGHSQQAPSGFIDKAADIAQRALVAALRKMLDEVFS